MRVLILGINGFTGHRLTEAILSKADWEIFGMDVSAHRLEQSLRYPRLHFHQGDITKHKDWVMEHIAKVDVVLPLIDTKTMQGFFRDPLKVFEIDFEANLEVIKQVVRAQKRLVFPSSSEVYGMSDDQEFHEQSSKLAVGPVEKEGWMYAAVKQLLERLIFAYGKHQGLKYTIYRSFNWIGPEQDELSTAVVAPTRVVSRFIHNIIHNHNLVLVNGGQQKRSFTYIDDGIDALMKIIENKDNCAEGHIFNIGNPNNNISIADLAMKIKNWALTYPKYHDVAEQMQIISMSSQDFYGKSFQEMNNRLPSIEKAKKHLHWRPKTDLDIALRNTLDFYLR